MLIDTVLKLHTLYQFFVVVANRYGVDIWTFEI